MSSKKFGELLLAQPIFNDDNLWSDKIKATPITISALKELFGTNKLPGDIADKNGFAFWRNSPLYNDSGANEGYPFRTLL